MFDPLISLFCLVISIRSLSSVVEWATMSFVDRQFTFVLLTALTFELQKSSFGWNHFLTAFGHSLSNGHVHDPDEVRGNVAKVDGFLNVWNTLALEGRGFLSRWPRVQCEVGLGLRPSK